MEISQVQNKAVNYLLIALSLTFVALAVVRAIEIPLTHDEAVSWSIFVPKSTLDIIGYVETYGMPNNHIVNTLLVKLSSFIFGSSTLAIRLPNLLGLVLFLYGSFRLLQTINSQWIRIAGFILLTCNPYTFDFFCLARGYGIANACMMMMLWKVYDWMNQPRERTMVSALVFGSLMVLSNFTTLHVFLIALLIVTILALKKRGAVSVVRTIRSPLIVFLVLGAILYEPFRCILKWKTTYGGNTGFWTDSVLPLFVASGNQAVGNPTLLLLASFAIPILIVLAGVGLFKQYKTDKFRFVHMLAMLLLGCALMFQLQNLILKSEFPVARAVQFISPLFILLLVFSFNTTNWFSKTGRVVLSSVALVVLIHFCTSINLGHVNEWKYDAMNREVVEDLKSISIKENRNIHTRISWIFEPGLNYERVQQNAKLLVPFDRTGIDSTADYYYVTREDSLLLAAKGKAVVQYYAVSESSLMK